MLMAEGITSSEGPFAFAMAPGDVSAAEAAAAILEGNTAGPDDTTQTRTQDNAYNIIQKTYKMFSVPRTAGEDAWLVLDMKLPGRGLPFNEDQGWNYFIFNLDPAALTTGVVVKGNVQLMGVWLRD